MKLLSVIKNLPLKTNSRILDINNGINIDYFYLSQIFPNSRLTTISKDKEKTKNIIKSLEQKNITNAHEKFNIFHFEYDNGGTLPFVDNSHDLIIISGVLRNVIYRESFLKECSRILAKGGFILVTELNEDAHGITTHPDSRILFDDMLEYLDTAGITIVENFDTDSFEYGIIGVCS